LFGETVEVDQEMQELPSKPQAPPTSKLKSLLRATTYLAENTFAKLRLTREKILAGAQFMLMLEANSRLILRMRNFANHTFLISEGLTGYD
jgi:hypothetical protein